jgi:hypothetical protein
MRRQTIKRIMRKPMTKKTALPPSEKRGGVASSSLKKKRVFRFTRPL